MEKSRGHGKSKEGVPKDGEEKEGQGHKSRGGTIWEKKSNSEE